MTLHNTTILLFQAIPMWQVIYVTNTCLPPWRKDFPKHVIIERDNCIKPVRSDPATNPTDCSPDSKLIHKSNRYHHSFIHSTPFIQSDWLLPDSVFLNPSAKRTESSTSNERNSTPFIQGNQFKWALGSGSSVRGSVCILPFPSFLMLTPPFPNWLIDPLVASVS